jgi:hypothetical protein
VWLQVAFKHSSFSKIQSKKKERYFFQTSRDIIYRESIRDVAWNVTSDAQFILAIAFPKSVGIFGQRRANNTYDEKDHWVCYTKFDVDT